MIVTFLSGCFEILMFLKTDIDIDIPNICLMFGSEQSRGEERRGQGKGRVCWREYFKAISSPTLRAKLGLASSLNNCTSPSSVLGSEHIFNIETAHNGHIARLGVATMICYG